MLGNTQLNFLLNKIKQLIPVNNLNRFEQLSQKLYDTNRTQTTDYFVQILNLITENTSVNLLLKIYEQCLEESVCSYSMVDAFIETIKASGNNKCLILSTLIKASEFLTETEYLLLAEKHAPGNCKESDFINTFFKFIPAETKTTSGTISRDNTAAPCANLTKDQPLRIKLAKIIDSVKNIYSNRAEILQLCNVILTQDQNNDAFVLAYKNLFQILAKSNKKDLTKGLLFLADDFGIDITYLSEFYFLQTSLKDADIKAILTELPEKYKILSFYKNLLGTTCIDLMTANKVFEKVKSNYRADIDTDIIFSMLDIYYHNLQRAILDGRLLINSYSHHFPVIQLEFTHKKIFNMSIVSIPPCTPGAAFFMVDSFITQFADNFETLANNSKFAICPETKTHDTIKAIRMALSQHSMFKVDFEIDYVRNIFIVDSNTDYKKSINHYKQLIN